MLVKRGRARVDGGGVDADFNFAGLGRTVKLDSALFLVEAATVGGGAKVSNLKRDKGMGGVNGVVSRLDLRNSDEQGGCNGGR